MSLTKVSQACPSRRRDAREASQKAWRFLGILQEDLPSFGPVNLGDELGLEAAPRNQGPEEENLPQATNQPPAFTPHGHILLLLKHQVTQHLFTDE